MNNAPGQGLKLMDNHTGHIRILSCGPFVQLQDRGRFGQLSVGLTRAGAADETSYNWANKLLGNPFGTPVLEISMGPFEAEFSAPVRFSISGADMQATLDGKAVPNGSTAVARTGSRLRMGPPRYGLHTYLAVKSGWRAEIWLGSVSVAARERDIWKSHSVFKKGTELHWNEPFGESSDILTRRIPWEYLDPKQEEIPLRFILDETSDFSWRPQLDQLQQQVWTVSSRYDRMGYRLQGKPITDIGTLTNSHGICRGMIQVPPDGYPIVLLNEHQTMGGYPVIGCVTHESCDRLNQCRQGTRIRFVPQDLDEAQQQRIAFLKFFQRTF